MTPSGYIGDTVRYAADVVAYGQGHETRFWEFGHLLWRPWGFVGHKLFAGWYAEWFGDTPARAVTRFLIHTNFICSAAALLLMLFLLRKVAGPWIAGFVVFAMSCSISFLNYSHSGTPYIPALLFSGLTLLLLITAAENPIRGRRFALLAGASFALACALWFPSGFTGLGMLAALYLWPSRDSDVSNDVSDKDDRRRLAQTFLLSLAALSSCLFAAGAAAKGIGSVSQLSQWVLESDNGWSQSRTLMRAVTGLSRSLWELGGDTVLLKRWLFHDPYNPVRIATLIFSLGGKLAVFYLGFGAALWVLWKEYRALLFILVAAGLPLLLFAVMLFEPSSPERFLPVFPFSFLAFAAVLARARRHVVPSACIVILLGAAALLNLAGKWGLGVSETRDRILALNGAVQPGALVTVATLYDGLYRIPNTYPLDITLAHSRFDVTYAVVIASRTTARWRTAFAERTLEQWARHKEAWFSERLLAPRPEARWLWVEGDDRRIRWPELPAAFGQLETDRSVQLGNDGFLRAAESQSNQDLLAKWAAATGETSR